MAGPVSTKTEKEKSAGKAEGRAPELAFRSTLCDPYAGIMDLQNTAGNQAVSQSLQADNIVPPIVREVLRIGSRQPLDSTVREYMESRFGHDFSQVRVHTNAKAAESAAKINASAYTIGTDLIFANGEYAPYSASGRQLLAHELTHVIQQSRGRGEAWHSQSVMENEAESVSKLSTRSEAGHLAVKGSVPYGSIQMGKKKNPQKPTGSVQSIPLPRKPKNDPRWLLSLEEQMRYVQTSPEVNREAAHRRQGNPFTPPPGGGIVKFGMRNYEFDQQGNLVKAWTDRLTLGVRDRTVYQNAPGIKTGEDFGHLLGIDFGHIDAELGRHGGFPQAAYLNRDTGGGKQPLWYDAERKALEAALKLHQENKPYRVEARAQGYVNGRPNQTRIIVYSGSEKVFDSKWIPNPMVSQPKTSNLKESPGQTKADQRTAKEPKQKTAKAVEAAKSLQPAKSGDESATVSSAPKAAPPKAKQPVVVTVGIGGQPKAKQTNISPPPKKNNAGPSAVSNASPVHSNAAISTSPVAQGLTSSPAKAPNVVYSPAFPSSVQPPMQKVPGTAERSSSPAAGEAKLDTPAASASPAARFGHLETAKPGALSVPQESPRPELEARFGNFTQPGKTMPAPSSTNSAARFGYIEPAKPGNLSSNQESPRPEIEARFGNIPSTGKTMSAPSPTEAPTTVSPVKGPTFRGLGGKISGLGSKIKSGARGGIRHIILFIFQILMAKQAQDWENERIEHDIARLEPEILESLKSLKTKTTEIKKNHPDEDVYANITIKISHNTRLRGHGPNADLDTVYSGSEISAIDVSTQNTQDTKNEENRYFGGVFEYTIITHSELYESLFQDLEARKETMTLFSDTEIRDWLKKGAPSVIQGLPVYEKIRLINRLLDGWISDEDVSSIERICQSVVNTAEASEISDAVGPRLRKINNLGQRLRVRYAIQKMTD